jgi:hypothetical protein
MKKSLIFAVTAILLSPNLYAKEIRCFAKEGRLDGTLPAGAHLPTIELKDGSKKPGSLQYILTAKGQSFSFYALIDEGMNTFLPEIDAIDKQMTLRGPLAQILAVPAGDYAERYSKLFFVQNGNLAEVGCAIVK